MELTRTAFQILDTTNNNVLDACIYAHSERGAILIYRRVSGDSWPYIVAIKKI